MGCDVKHVHFCVTSLVKLHGLAVVSAILTHPKEERVCGGWEDVVCGWGFGCCCFFQKMRNHSRVKADTSALSVSIQLPSQDD